MRFVAADDDCGSLEDQDKWIEKYKEEELSGRYKPDLEERSSGMQEDVLKSLDV